MQTKLVGKGFINNLEQNGSDIFATVSIKATEGFDCYRCLVDREFVSIHLNIAPIEELKKYFNKKPVLVCIANPTAAIKDGKILRGGIVKGWTDVSMVDDLFRSRYAESLFSVFKD